MPMIVLRTAAGVLFAEAVLPGAPQAPRTTGPLVDARKANAVIEEAPVLSAARKRDILSHNAARFLRLDGAR